jgi:hypothetical protein
MKGTLAAGKRAGAAAYFAGTGGSGADSALAG